MFWFQKEHMFCQWPSWTSSLGQRGVDRNPLRSSNPCCHMASLLSRYWVPWEAESWVIPSEGVRLLSRCRAAWLLAWNCRVDTYTFPWQPWAQTTHQPPQSTQTPGYRHQCIRIPTLGAKHGGNVHPESLEEGIKRRWFRRWSWQQMAAMKNLEIEPKLSVHFEVG